MQLTGSFLRSDGVYYNFGIEPDGGFSCHVVPSDKTRFLWVSEVPSPKVLTTLRFLATWVDGEFYQPPAPLDHAWYQPIYEFVLMEHLLLGHQHTYTYSGFNQKPTDATYNAIIELLIDRLRSGFFLGEVARLVTFLVKHAEARVIPADLHKLAYRYLVLPQWKRGDPADIEAATKRGLTLLLKLKGFHSS